MGKGIDKTGATVWERIDMTWKNIDTAEGGVLERIDTAGERLWERIDTAEARVGERIDTAGEREGCGRE